MKRPRQDSPSIERATKMIRRPIKQLDSHDYLLKVTKTTAVTNGSELKEYFHKHTEEEVEAYGFGITKAIRSQDINLLREMHSQGQIFQCSNRFGESILHMACRQGSFEVVKFLVEQAKVSIRIKDDFGKTPLHDAFWTVSPNKKIVNLLLENCPSLLFVTDVRGHAPLQYARMEHHQLWIEFLSERLSLISKGLEDIEEAVANK